jgi:hypothetical protein
VLRKALRLYRHAVEDGPGAVWTFASGAEFLRRQSAGRPPRPRLW